jgi:hypothetical protein
MDLNKFRKEYPNLAIITISVCISLWMNGLSRIWEQVPYILLMCLTALLYFSLDDGNLTEMFGIQAHEQNKQRFNLVGAEADNDQMNLLASAVDVSGTKGISSGHSR